MSPVGYAEFTKLAEALVMVSPLKVASVTVRKGVVVVALTVTVDLVSGFVGATRDRPGVMVTTSGVCGGSALKVSAVTVYEPLAPVREITWPETASVVPPFGSVRDRLVAPWASLDPADRSMVPAGLASKYTPADPGSEPLLFRVKLSPPLLPAAGETA